MVEKKKQAPENDATQWQKKNTFWNNQIFGDILYNFQLCQ